MKWRLIMAKDPVCGMNVDENKAIAVVNGGKTYYFCSAACKSTFEKAPAKYTGK
jgi:Cu+-exporting ATPase